MWRVPTLSVRTSTPYFTPQGAKFGLSSTGLFSSHLTSKPTYARWCTTLPESEHKKIEPPRAPVLWERFKRILPKWQYNKGYEWEDIMSIIKF